MIRSARRTLLREEWMGDEKMRVTGGKVRGKPRSTEGRGCWLLGYGTFKHAQ